MTDDDDMMMIVVLLIVKVMPFSQPVSDLVDAIVPEWLDFFC